VSGEEGGAEPGVGGVFSGDDRPGKMRDLHLSGTLTHSEEGLRRMFRRRAALFALASAIAVPVTIALPVGPAGAALPTKNTVYRDARLDASDHVGSMTIKVGANTHKIAKLVIVADCGGEKEKFVRRNIPIKDNGIFTVAGGGRYVSIAGKFRTEDRVTGSFTTNQCGFFGGDFAATT
jgi:hypothetical protein